MGDVKRYTIRGDWRLIPHPNTEPFNPSDSHDVVLYTDHETALTQAETRIRELQKELAELKGVRL